MGLILPPQLNSVPTLVTASHNHSGPHTYTPLRCFHSRTPAAPSSCAVISRRHLAGVWLMETNVCVTLSQNKAVRESRSAGERSPPCTQQDTFEACGANVRRGSNKLPEARGP